MRLKKDWEDIDRRMSSPKCWCLEGEGEVDLTDLRVHARPMRSALTGCLVIRTAYQVRGLDVGLRLTFCDHGRHFDRLPYTVCTCRGERKKVKEKLKL